MNKFYQLLMYGGMEKNAFMNVYDDITESNRENLVVFSLITLIGMAVMVLFSFLVESLVKNRIAYVFCVLVSAVLYVVSSRCDKSHKRTIYTCMYIFAGMLYAFGIALGTFVEPNEVSASFPIMLFAIPLLLTDVPIHIGVLNMASIVLYSFVARATQNSLMFEYNMSNVVPYGVISVIVSTYMMKIKIHRHVLEYQNKHLIETDQLTGMLNRRSFEQYVRLLRVNGCARGMLVCAFDVNGLKMVNDNIGHHAGDELIHGAANCIEGVFDAYGRCYRTGGDEFMAILEGAAPSMEELKKALAMRCACFNGSFVSGLSIAVGMVAASGDNTIDELIKAADKEMYADKDDYYDRTGSQRRDL